VSTLLKILAAALSLLSERGARKVGAILGGAWFHIIRIRRKTVLSNLQKALPGSSRADRLRIAGEAFRHFGITAVEFLRMSRMKKEEVAAWVEVEGMSNFEAAAAKNKGIIAVTAHLGNFDLLAASQAARGIPLAVVSRNLHQGGANRFWMESRKRCGLEIFEDKGAARKILRHLKNNKVVALTVDQRTKSAKGGVLLPFMGHPAMTGTAPAALAAASGAPLVPVRIERLSDGRHRAIIEPEIPFFGPRTRDALIGVTEKINEISGNWIVSRPEQYMWLHRRYAPDDSHTDLSQNR
jgi:Kdo2-lipid IVA lauroyltransferase/acyltransferase